MLTVALTDGEYGACPDCKRLQELETRADPCRQLCDNCAFRPNSPERSDPWGWMRLEEGFAAGRAFYCHKGMASKLGPDNDNLTYLPGDDETELTPCAGWIAHQKARAVAS